MSRGGLLRVMARCSDQRHVGDSSDGREQGESRLQGLRVAPMDCGKSCC